MKKQIYAVVVATLASAMSMCAQADQGIAYERISMTYTPLQNVSQGVMPRSQTFGVHAISLFDTTGAIRAGIGNALSKNGAEYQKKQELGKANAPSGTYEYSWQERQPVANDGSTYKVMWSSEGSPWSVMTSSFQVNQTTDYTPSFWGFEFEHPLWSYKGSPVSFGINFGGKMHLYNNVVGWSLDRGSLSMPLGFTASAVPVNDLTVYANAAFGPYGYIKHYATYNHIEAGAAYKLTPNLRLTSSFRKLTDYLTQDAKLTDYGKYETTMLSVGMGLIW